MIKPYLYGNGGPIIAVQVENEYGSYHACDNNYMEQLRDIILEQLGNDTVLFTTDGNLDSYLKCGTVANVYPTIDFGPASKSAINASFGIQRKYAPKGPLVNSEFYPGWLDQWGGRHANVSSESVVTSMSIMWKMGASFNFYMFHGGTNFDFFAGGGGAKDDQFYSVTTSYDYDAPISEAGDLTPKYMAIRSTIAVFKNRQIRFPIPKESSKYSYGNVTMQKLGTITEMLNYIVNKSKVIKSKYPLSFEDMNHGYGFMLYSTIIPKAGNLLVVPGVRDRGYVMVNDSMIGILQRPANLSTKTASFKVTLKKGYSLKILVENQGRKADGMFLNDSKGVLNNASLDGSILTNWTHQPIELSLLKKFNENSPLKSYISNGSPKPTLYAAKFNISNDKIGDTFFDPTGWTKGQVLINGVNLGRYWPKMGPQVRLYVPKFVLSTQNEIILLDLESNCSNRCNVSLVNHPKL